MPEKRNLFARIFEKKVSMSSGIYRMKMKTSFPEEIFILPDIITVGNKQKRKIIFFDENKNRSVSLSFVRKISTSRIVKLAAKGDPFFHRNYPNLYKSFIYQDYKGLHNPQDLREEYRNLLLSIFSYNLYTLHESLLKRISPFISGEILALKNFLHEYELPRIPEVTYFNTRDADYIHFKSKKGTMIDYLYPTFVDQGLVGMIEYSKKDKNLLELVTSQIFFNLKWRDSGVIRFPLSEQEWNAFTILDYLKNVETVNTTQETGPFYFYSYVSKFSKTIT